MFKFNKSLTVVIALLVSTLAFSTACTPRAWKNRGNSSSEQTGTEQSTAPQEVSNQDVLDEQDSSSSAAASSSSKSSSNSGDSNKSKSSSSSQKDSSATAASSSGKTKDYVVKKGDTLSELAEKYGTTTKKLAKMNNISDADKITAGDTIKVPAK